MTRTLDRPGVDLVLELGETNAPRRCAKCDSDADYYVYTDAVYSKYICEAHLDDAAAAAEA